MTDITIPDEVVEAAAKALAAVRMPNYTWNDLDRGMQKYLRSDARAALRAGLAAWPGMECKNTCGSYPPFPHIILPFPLPKEISDA